MWRYNRNVICRVLQTLTTWETMPLVFRLLIIYLYIYLILILLKADTRIIISNIWTDWSYHITHNGSFISCWSSEYLTMNRHSDESCKFPIWCQYPLYSGSLPLKNNGACNFYNFIIQLFMLAKISFICLHYSLFYIIHHCMLWWELSASLCREAIFWNDMTGTPISTE